MCCVSRSLSAWLARSLAGFVEVLKSTKSKVDEIKDLSSRYQVVDLPIRSAVIAGSFVSEGASDQPEAILWVISGFGIVGLEGVIGRCDRKV